MEKTLFFYQRHTPGRHGLSKHFPDRATGMDGWHARGSYSLANRSQLSSIIPKIVTFSLCRVSATPPF
jgi:hypothetical protein